MTYYIFDTNILIRDPEIITKWSPNYKIIIPKFIFPELDKVSSRLGFSSILFETINKAENKDFIHIDNSEIKVSPEIRNKDFEQKLSNVDFELFQLAENYKKEGKKVVLVTNDRALQIFANKNGIESLNMFQYLSAVKNYKKTEINDLKNKENITEFQNRKFIYGLACGIFLMIITYLIKENFTSIYNSLNIWGTLLLLFLSGIIFFLFRTNFRLAYGIVEIIFGFYITSRTFIENNFEYSNIDIVQVIQIIGGIYVMVRGFSNVDDGIKGTLFEPIWNKITRFRKIGSA